MFRLMPKAFIGNTGWTANARINYLMDVSSDSNNQSMADTDGDNDSAGDMAYVEGPIGSATVQAGRLRYSLHRVCSSMIVSPVLR